jgi:TolB-like protein
MSNGGSHDQIIQQIVVIIICIAVSQQLVAQSASPTVAVSDLQVSSDNASYAYLGKGFAEIVSFELSKSPQLRLVAREQRNAALKEMDFALSGLADEDNQLKAGKMLSVRYMVYGSVTDMGDSLLVSLKMMDVETGQVVWSDQALEPGSRYARIGASLAKSLLSHFKLAVAKSTEQAAAAETPVKPATVAAVVALSEGIAALDKGDTKAARASLETAARIDPDSALVAALLGKLASASAKFKVAPSATPATGIPPTWAASNGTSWPRPQPRAGSHTAIATRTATNQ